MAPDNEGGTLLLTNEQDPINTLGATAFFVWGWDAIDPSTNASLPNEQELDLALR